MSVVWFITYSESIICTPTEKKTQLFHHIHSQGENKDWQVPQKVKAWDAKPAALDSTGIPVYIHTHK